MNKLYALIALTRLNKPIGIYLLLWPTLWALWLAQQGFPDTHVLILFVLGVICMRSAGCIVNDIVDRHWDGQVERTKTRPLATKAISMRVAIGLFFILVCLAFLIVYQFNSLTIFLSFIAGCVAIIYPFLKRWTSLPQVGLGVAFSFGIPCGFAAIRSQIPLEAWCLFLTALIWPLIYDTMYAMADRADDLKIGLRSLAILFGSADKIIIGLLQILFLSALIGVGLLFHLHTIYYVSLSSCALFFIYQQILIKNRDPKNCFNAFLNNHWVGCSIFLGVFLSYL